MAAVTIVKARATSPAGYEVNDTAILAADMSAGTQVVYNGSVSGGLAVVAKAGTSATEAHAILLEDGKAGDAVSIGIQGEMDGFSGLTPGTALYPSGSTAGGIDTTAPSGATIRMRAVTASRVRFSFI